MKSVALFFVVVSLMSVASFSPLLAAEEPMGPVLDRTNLAVVVEDLQKDAIALRSRLKEVAADLASASASANEDHAARSDQ